MRYPSALPSNTANTSLIFSLAFNLYDFINSHEFWNSSLPQQNSVIFCFVFFVIVLSYSDLQMCMNVNYLYHNWSLWSIWYCDCESSRLLFIWQKGSNDVGKCVSIIHLVAIMFKNSSSSIVPFLSWLKSKNQDIYLIWHSL